MILTWSWMRRLPKSFVQRCAILDIATVRIAFHLLRTGCRSPALTSLCITSRYATRKMSRVTEPRQISVWFQARLVRTQPHLLTWYFRPQVKATHLWTGLLILRRIRLMLILHSACPWLTRRFRNLASWRTATNLATRKSKISIAWSAPLSKIYFTIRAKLLWRSRPRAKILLKKMTKNKGKCPAEHSFLMSRVSLSYTRLQQRIKWNSTRKSQSTNTRCIILYVSPYLQKKKRSKSRELKTRPPKNQLYEINHSKY